MCSGVFVYPLGYFTLMPLDGTEGDKIAWKSLQKFGVTSKSANGLLFHSISEIDKCGLIFLADVILCHQN